ncbi:uncharacterized protein PHALS_03875 [Plasmopara halstedii]|uniref:RxLR-like protein n=1 Tax=Plasmopara halstedii TaxID=4781 RepID=A0A0N7L7J2_PLAHL|nr:uncharacterized protein PHALS_03875 [Plasmopara halstedii]CEG47227.1 hypothetical protein PHALS_03875 [Plasmopara halstedii]|eukprot:XP_024583596.1 hypothetical protein PHALS_03875 [Plasmopara halstedii]
MRVNQIIMLVLLSISTRIQIASTASCSDKVSSGDKGVGISAEDAPLCPTNGGVGCFGGSVACRFCMAFSTPQSSHLAACKAKASSSSVSPTVTPSATPSTVAPSSTTTNDDCIEDLTVA